MKVTRNGQKPYMQCFKHLLLEVKVDGCEKMFDVQSVLHDVQGVL
jgi:hypothetical protein